MSDHAYIAVYRGVQLGFEAFAYTPQPVARSPRIDQLFRSPRASIVRPTSARYTQHQVVCHVRGSDMVDVADLVETYGALMDEQAGTLEIFQGLTAPLLRRPVTDAFLIDVRPESRREPSRAHIVPTVFEFVTSSAGVS